MTSAGQKKWQEFPALEATRRMNSINSPAMFEGLASSQIAFAAAMADMMRNKEGPDPKPKAAAVPAAPAAFDKDMLARLAQQAADAPQEEVVEAPPAPEAPAAAPAFQLPPGFSLVSFETEEEAAQALQEMEEEEPPPPLAPPSMPHPDFQQPSGSANSQPVIGHFETPGAPMGPGRGFSPPRSAVPAQPARQPARGDGKPAGEQTTKVKSIVDNVMGAWKATADRNLAAALVAPPAAKAAPISRPPPASSAGLPGAESVYLPPATNQPQPQGVEGGDGEDRQDANRQEDQGWAEIRDRRRQDRARSRSTRRRSGSRGRGRGRSRSDRRGRRQRSGEPRRSKSRKRQSGFSSGAPGAAAASSAVAQPKSSNNKFSSTASVQLNPSNVPDWLKDLAEPQIPRELLGRKVLRMPDAYIKCLIGRGGETIRQIINKTGADIKIETKSDNTDGLVSIANNPEAAVKLIQQVLAAKGCHWETQETTDLAGKLTNVGWKGHVDDDDLQIPTELVGLFIGNAGAGIKEIKARVGGAVTIKVLPPLLPGGFQVIQVVGDKWKAAREVVRAKIQEILTTTPGRWHAPGFSTQNPGMSSNAGYMPTFGATPGVSITREPMREGRSVNVVNNLMPTTMQSMSGTSL